MACVEIQELLSEYIDGTLDAKDVVVVERHISTCTTCKEELIAMRAMVKELGALEPVEAPDDFLEKIHERMEAYSDFNRLVRKLFVPFRVKIPLQLAAAATVAVFVVLLLNIQKPEIQKMQPSKAYKLKGIAKIPETDHMKPAFTKEGKYPAPVAEEAPETFSDSEHRMPARKYSAKTAAEPSIQGKPEQASSISSKIRPSVGREHPIELALVLKTGVIGQAYAPDTAVKSAPMLKRDKKTLEYEPTEKDASELKNEAGRKDRVDDFFSTMEHMIRPLNGKILSVEYYLHTDRLKSIHVQIPTKSYASFCSELNRLATFKTPPPARIDTSLETVKLLIRVTYPE